MRKNPATRTVVKKFDVPIYGATVWIIVADNVAEERNNKRWTRLFGYDTLQGDYSALCSWNRKSHFGLFFQRGKAGLPSITHEALHLTFTILNWWRIEVSQNHQEAAAALHEWLLPRICEKLGMKWTAPR